MKTNGRIGLSLLLFAGACGSSSSNPKPSLDAPGSPNDLVRADTGPVADRPATGAETSPAAETGLPGKNDGAAPDGGSPPVFDGAGAPDFPATADLALDGGAGIDAPAVSAEAGTASDGPAALVSTTTSDNSTQPTICSTVRLGVKDLSANQTYDIVMPDCLRMSGTVTLASPLPDGAVWGNGSVNVFKVIRDTNGRVTDNVSYAASITAIDSSHFSYSVGVPADTYEVMYDFAVKSSATLPSVASRIGQEHLVISGSIKHDVTLPAIDVATRTVTVTGTEALAGNGNAFGRFIEVVALNASHTLMVNGMSMTGGASVPIGMWVPKETITPFIMVQESPGAISPYVSGYVSQFQLADVTPSADFRLALPAAVKLSGTVSDPYAMLSPMLGAGGAGSSAVSYYHCDSLDTGTFPNPIFFYPEGSTSSFFSASTSHAFYARKGLACVTYANYAIATGAPGATPTRAGENTYAFMQDPTPKSPDAVTLSTDLTRNINVPNLGAQVTVTGTVKDARGQAIPNANLAFVSRTLSTAAVADKTLVGGLDVNSSGTYTAHALPGTYDMTIQLPASTTSPPTVDAGTTGTGDAAPDVAFSLPEVGPAGTNCATLAACCPTLTSTSQTLCNTLVSTNVDSSCATYLSLFRLGGSCP